MEGTFYFIDDNITIVNPSIESINESLITLDNVTKTISVTVVLTDPSGSKFTPVHAFEDIPRDSENWDSCDCTGIVMTRLETFRV